LFKGTPRAVPDTRHDAHHTSDIEIWRRELAVVVVAVAATTTRGGIQRR
jgi:hypothetical protein